MHNEVGIVRWYIEVFENGFDTMRTLQDFLEAQKKI